MNAPMMKTETRVRGEFDVALRKCNSAGEPIEAARTIIKGCKNLITDGGMAALGTGGYNAFSSSLQVGTSNTTPANSDTVLGARVAGVTSSTSYNAGSGIWSWDTMNPKAAVATRVYTFAAGAATGNLAELGLATNTTGPVNTRALFMSGGSPVTVSPQVDEQLIVTYRVFFTASETDSVLVTTQKGVEYTLTLRPARLGVALPSANVAIDFFARIGAITQGQGTPDAVTIYYGATSAAGATVVDGPTGTSFSYRTNDTPVVWGTTNTAGGWWRDDVVTIPLGFANVSNLGAYELHGLPFRTQINVSPRLTKTSTDTVKITVRTTWARG